MPLKFPKVALLNGTYYTAVSERDRDSSADEEAKSPRDTRYYAARQGWSTPTLVCWVVVVAILAGISRWFAAQGIFDAEKRNPVGLAGTITTIFEPQEKYAMASSNETDQLWSDLFPPAGGRGFVLLPNQSKPHGISVYHQLHCLDAIRRGYHAALNNEPVPPRSEPSHIRHCIDYIRQSMLCDSDTNLEPTIDDSGGVNRWGFERKCRDFTGVRDWAEKWSVGIEGIDSPGHDHGHGR